MISLGLKAPVACYIDSENCQQPFFLILKPPNPINYPKVLDAEHNMR